MRPGSLEGEWNKFRKTSLHGYGDGIDVLLCIDFIKQSNPPEVTTNIDRTGAGRSARIMREAVIERVLFKVTRAFAKSIRPDDHHTRVGIDFLRRPGVIEEETDPTNRKALTAAIADFERLESDPRLVGIGHYRDKTVAQIGLPDDTKPAPMARDLFDFAIETAKVWELARRGADPHMISMQFYLEQYRSSSMAFLASLEQLACRENGVDA